MITRDAVDSQDECLFLQASVIVPVYRDTAMTLRCLESVLASSGPELDRLIVIDDASPEPDLASALEGLAGFDRRVKLIKFAQNQGFIAACNRGLAERKGGGDAVLLNSDTIVTHGWLRELAEVAHTDDRTGCVSPLSNNATICSVPRFCEETPAAEIDAQAIREACRDLPKSTVIPTAVGFCMYMRGPVIDVVGTLDPAFGLGYNEENDWCMRAQIMGFVARRANRAFVYHFGSASFQGRKQALEQRNARILLARHPQYLDQVRNFCNSIDGPIAAHAVRARSSGILRVGIDLRHLPLENVGTSAYASELVRALARSNEIDLTLIVHSRDQSRGLPARTVLEREAGDDFDVLHKPAQVFEARDANLLLRSRAGLVISYLDLIAIRAQGIFANHGAAQAYQSMSHMITQSAQATIAISEHSRSEIARELGVPASEVVVTPLGVEKERFQRGSAIVGQVPSGRFWLSVATDFPHKNIRSLLDAYQQVRSEWRAGEPPDLCLIGGRTDTRNSAYRQMTNREIPGIVYLGRVSHERLVELYQTAIALVFPSVYEGFGLPILEAMAAGTPVIAFPLTSIPEVGGDAVVYPDGMSTQALARAMVRIAYDHGLRNRHVINGLARAEQFTWERTAEQTIEAYRRAVFAPSERSLRARRLMVETMRRWNIHSGHFGVYPKVLLRKALRRVKRVVAAEAKKRFGR